MFPGLDEPKEIKTVPYTNFGRFRFSSASYEGHHLHIRQATEFGSASEASRVGMSLLAVF